MGRGGVATIVSSWIIPISILVNTIVPEPYMDEIFHVPQAQQYCKGNFRAWDPMITTPPGLYYLSLAHITCLFPGIYFARFAAAFSDLCTTVILRSVNGVLAVLCAVLVYEIIIQLRPKFDECKAMVLSIVLALYPLHWFFTFLYYTDVASLCVVLAMYLACLKKKYFLSAMFGAYAVFIRQTNVVWMLFVSCSEVIDIAVANQKDSRKVDDSVVLSRKNEQIIRSGPEMAGSDMRRRKNNHSAAVNKGSMVSRRASTASCPTGFYREIVAICFTTWRMKWKLMLSFSPFLMVLMAFVAFVHWNGSVVLGAKDAHAVSPHFAQIMYFSVVSILATAPMHFSLHQVTSMLKSFWTNKSFCFCQWLIALTAGFVSVHYYSIAHPYLLADNRHYPFYLWRKVINAHHMMKYFLVPLYVYAWFSIFSTLGKSRPKIWVLMYFLATAAVLVPAPLIEFRYYTIPFFFLVLHSDINSYRTMALMALIYIVINVFTLAMFLFRPFHWKHEPGVQRFIW